MNCLANKNPPNSAIPVQSRREKGAPQAFCPSPHEAIVFWRREIPFTLAVIFLSSLLNQASYTQIQFFGKMDADIQSIETSQPGSGIASRRIRVTTNASRFGAKGTIELERDLHAVWQIATRVNLSGAETGGGGGLFTLWGNTRVGLQGKFGTVFLGVWDTPFRQSYDRVDLFDNSHIASPIGLLGSIGNSVGGSATLPTTAQGFPSAVANVGVNSTCFHRRQKSSLQYWSPVIQSLQVRLAYSIDDPGAKTATADPSLLSISAAYDTGPLYIGTSYERHQDLKVLAGANVAGIDYGARAIACVQIADERIGIVYELLSFSTVGIGRTARSALSVSGSSRLGAHAIGAVYTTAGDLTGGANTGASQWSVYYGFFFSDTVELYGQLTTIRNSANAAYNFGDGLNVATSQGANLTGVGVGLACSF